MHIVCKHTLRGVNRPHRWNIHVSIDARFACGAVPRCTHALARARTQPARQVKPIRAERQARKRVADDINSDAHCVRLASRIRTHAMLTVRAAVPTLSAA